MSAEGVAPVWKYESRTWRDVPYFAPHFEFRNAKALILLEGDFVKMERGKNGKGYRRSSLLGLPRPLLDASFYVVGRLL